MGGYEDGSRRYHTDYKGRDNRELRRGAMSLARPWILLCTVEYSRIGHNKRGKKGD